MSALALNHLCIRMSIVLECSRHVEQFTVTVLVAINVRALHANVSCTWILKLLNRSYKIHCFKFKLSCTIHYISTIYLDDYLYKKHIHLHVERTLLFTMTAKGWWHYITMCMYMYMLIVIPCWLYRCTYLTFIH